MSNIIKIISDDIKIYMNSRTHINYKNSKNYKRMKGAEKALESIKYINGKQLLYLIKLSIDLVKVDFNDHCLFYPIEIMFEYKRKIYYIGIKYDVRNLKKYDLDDSIFNEALLIFYLKEDKKNKNYSKDQIFYNFDDMDKNCKIENNLLRNIKTKTILPYDDLTTFYDDIE